MFQKLNSLALLLATVTAALFIAISSTHVISATASEASGPGREVMGNQIQASNFPVGKQTLKITIAEDGLYELTGADLTDAGMNVSGMDPDTLEMMHQGQPVAYQFVGDDDGTFEANESVRFYGWAFDGSRHDRLYVGDSNVFWLWADGTPVEATVVGNGVGGNVVTTWRSTVELEEENFFSRGEQRHRNDPSPDNEPDAWFMLGMTNGVTETITLELPDRVANGSDATVLVEVANESNRINHLFDVGLNGTLLETHTWDGIRNLNLTSSTSVASLQNGTNTISLYSHYRNSSGNIAFDDMLVNRVRVEYDRQLTAIDNHLQFSYATAGNHQFQVDGYTTAADIVAWNVTDRTAPTIITLNSGDITATGGNHTVRLSVNTSAESQFIVTTQLLRPASLETYTAPSLEPVANSAEWVAISHANFLAGANDLAQHRATFSNLTTHVVDVQDVYNQYGYGLATPAALQAFFTHALANWGLQYGVLVGDATENPLKRPCDTSRIPNCPPNWSTTDENFVVTDFQFIDRFAGMIATDHTFTTLVGDDELQDFVIGRLTGGTATEIQNIVDKIKLYETALRDEATWTQNMIWLADNADDAGRFCAEAARIRESYVTEFFNHEEICLDDEKYAGPGIDPTSLHKAAARQDFFDFIAIESARIVNYSGYGSNTEWAQNWISVGNDRSWQNGGRPTVILSNTSLEGAFEVSGVESISETFLRLGDGRGTAAHWGSTGVGFHREYLELQAGFYSALYENDVTRIGDATRASINDYIVNFPQGDISAPYSYVLQGDPAMLVVDDDMEPVEPSDFRLMLPMIVR